MHLAFIDLTACSHRHSQVLSGKALDLAVAEQLDAILILQHLLRLVLHPLTQVDGGLQGGPGLFLGCFDLKLGDSELLLELEVLHLQSLILAMSLPLLKLDSLDKLFLLLQVGQSLIDLVGHEFDLLTHGCRADLLSLLQGKS